MNRSLPRGDEEETRGSSVRSGNRLLAFLSPAATAALVWEERRIGDVLHTSNLRADRVFFPVDAVVSLFQAMRNGQGAQTAAVGFEGLIGYDVLLADSSAGRVSVIVAAGRCGILPASAFRAELESNASFSAAVGRYSLGLLTHLSRNAACNQLHDIEQHLARWLLHVLDRRPTATLQLTQDLVAHALGVRREGVTCALGRFERRGVLRKSRGALEILHRKGLEELACECYDAIRRAECLAPERPRWSPALVAPIRR